MERDLHGDQESLGDVANASDEKPLKLVPKLLGLGMPILEAPLRRATHNSHSRVILTFLVHGDWMSQSPAH